MANEAIEKTTAEPSDMLSVLSRVLENAKDLDVEKLERMLAMHERLQIEQRRQTFMEALSRLQIVVPQIQKNGKIIVKGVERSSYARLEDIDDVIRPMLADEGFSFSFDSESENGKVHIIRCKMSHRDGHSETNSIVLPLDASQYRSDVQSTGSTLSYARRQLIKMHLNLIERGEDKDGANLERISAEQAADLEAMLSEAKGDRAGFLRYMGVEAFADITVGNFARAIEALEQKRRGRK